jgi:hypothetical protein
MLNENQSDSNRPQTFQWQHSTTAANFKSAIKLQHSPNFHSMTSRKAVGGITVLWQIGRYAATSHDWQPT